MSESIISYTYNFYSDIKSVYEVIEKEQLKFFQQYKTNIEKLEKGLSIEKKLYTKTGQKPVKVKMKISEIIKNEKIGLSTLYNEGSILQTYDLSMEDGITTVVYSEDNQFEKKHYILNYKIVSLFYRFFYKRKIKKRMEYIEMIINNKEYSYEVNNDDRSN
ncbi:MAG: hypothetical protein RR630_00140 [Coprobacillus sp.]